MQSLTLLCIVVLFVVVNGMETVYIAPLRKTLAVSP